MTRNERDIGPRVVGGRYRCGYWGQEYTVEAIETERTDWLGWSITCRWADGSVTTHCTAWDPKLDSVVNL